MKKFTFTFFIISIFGLAVFAQESYMAMKVTGDNVPVIDGTIDAIWDNVLIVPLEKVPEKDGSIHPNITVPDPEPDDYYAEFGLLWNEDGLYALFRVVDDVIVIFEDFDPDNATPADKWWVDDNINLLFNKDLSNNTDALFTQWEFAWQPGIDQEEKLSSSDWLNAALIDISLVSSAWNQDGTTWTLETFIDWEAFADGSAVITPDMDIYMEARARDDDDEAVDDPWEAMFQWSTTNYEIENTGEGLGTVTLSSEEVTAPEAVNSTSENVLAARLVPSLSTGNTQLWISLDTPSDITVTLFDMSGKQVDELVFNNQSAGDNDIALDFSFLQQGVYLIHVNSGNNSNVLKYVKQ